MPTSARVLLSARFLIPCRWAQRQAHTVRPYRTGFAFSALLMPYRRAYLSRRAGGHKGRPYGAVSSSMGLYIMMAWFSVMNSSPSSAPSIPSTRRNRVLCRVKPPQYSPRISCSFS
ncbi:Uncharacterised protein [Flavonifractor plautii]|uniref:Uncharacterized protein n=1 Tax=Flavonifractor plautii TaxID=292800 RepID=A0A174VEZ5_FLAPL|nr:Uncharacterised protein [Flavonifractor plautii]